MAPWSQTSNTVEIGRILALGKLEWLGYRRSMSTRRTPAEQRKRFQALAKQISDRKPVSEAQLEWLESIFLALSDPERDVERVLGLHYTAGFSKKDDIAAQKMDTIMHWIAGAVSEDTSMYIDPNNAPPPMTLVAALDIAEGYAKRLFEGDPNSARYDREYLRKCWYDGDKRERRSPDREFVDFCHLRTLMDKD